MSETQLRPVPTVVIPVFNAFEELKCCLTSVSETVTSDTQVMVIDDVSTDSRILPLIEKFVNAGGPRWRQVHQMNNEGFVATANLGMRLAPRDVVLLNSDTVVTPGWLERIGMCLNSDTNIATATPWSNNSQITSIPEFCAENPVPENITSIAVRIAERVLRDGGPQYPEIPTAVGFCMGISRRAIDSVGYFDKEQFGKGYGEENDFCMRVRKQGFRNVLCDDTYVVHHGGSSFGPLGLRPDESSMARLLERHPDYHQLVADFIRSDPLAPIRDRLCSEITSAGLAFK
ncbi:MAG TPA: glycosyltransferase family 2 protein [Xanthomonadales bacterium]|nr:glycosyltransferase family 2 protein [Xanthomonadales bacterium]